MSRGTSTQGDLVTVTADGVSLDKLWNDYQATLEQANSVRTAIQSLFTFPTATPGDAVPQVTSRNDFEEASEFGEPVGLRVGPDVLRLGYDFRDYDMARRMTWKFLRDAPQSQVDMAHNLVMESDSRLLFSKIMSALLVKTTRVNDEGLNVYPLWSADGTVPPTYQANTFDGTHSHYLTTGAATVDSGDLEIVTEHVRHHGYGADSGAQLVAFVNPTQGNVIRTFRAGVANNNGAVAQWDFIPSEGAPTYLSSQQIVGEIPKATFGSLPIIGSYGPLLVTESGFWPTGYVAVIASGGPSSPLNPIGFREHANASYRGLRLLPGMRAGYPLVDSFYSRSFGTGVRLRGAAAVAQVTASGTYTNPTIV